MTVKVMKNRLVAVASLLIVALLAFVSCGGTKSNNKGKVTMDEIRKTDLSRLIMSDTIFLEPDDYVSETEENVFTEKNLEPRWFESIGFRGSDCQRFYIHYDSVYHKGNGVYRVYGRTRYRDTIRLFTGMLMLDSLWLNEEEYLPKYAEFGRLYGYYMYEEDEFSGGGVLSGKMRIDFAKVNGRFYYDAVMLGCADGYENSQYEGTWTSKDLSRNEKCNWGDFRIPDSQYLDAGAGEFSPDEKCLDRGWRIYTYIFEENDSLQALFRADEQWFTHENDYVIPYSGRLQRYLKTYGRHKRPAAKVVLATIPSTEEEFHVWYKVVEEPLSQDNHLWNLTSEYASADSTGIMFAYMRMGEFTDGYVSEGIFDDYIKLKKEYPALFAKYRKRLSRMWNEVFDEEEKLYGD